MSASTVSLQATQCRKTCTLAQVGNGQIVIDFNDDGPPGADWYTVTLMFSAQ